LALAARQKPLTSRQHINATVELSRKRLRASEDVFDKDNLFVGCSDGRSLNLATGEFVTTEAGIVTRKLGTSFDPEAQCPQWLEFLSTIFKGDQELIKFVQRVAGYSLTGETTEQCLFILTGTGANGKSTFLTILSKLLGNYAATTPMMTLMDSKFGQQQTSDLARLAGCRFVSASEGERGHKLAESKIKTMTGGDTIACRFLYQEHFQYQPQLKIFLSTNELPEVAGTDEAIWRRIRLIEFPVTIPEKERDPHLADKLAMELPGILNWAISGYREYANGGLNPPEQVTKVTHNYRNENDVFGQWLEDCCQLDKGVEESVKSLHSSYSHWCESNGLACVSLPRFGKELSRRGFANFRKGNGNWRRGIALRVEAFDIDDIIANVDTR
jgi:putative DNA primase/helicase